MNGVPMMDLKIQYQQIKSEIQSAIENVLEHGQYMLGDETLKLERDLATYCQVPFGLSTSSGTDSLILALLTIGIEPGDEVITSSISFVASAEVISLLKAKPVFVDIDPKTFCLDPKKVETAITKKTKAILPVHIFGQCADMDALLSLAERHDLWVIEDACQAIGAHYKGKKACSLGHLSAMSFYPSKNLGAFGDAGMLFVKEEALFLAARQYRTHGEYPKNFNHERIGLNARMSEIQAAILNVKFKYLDLWNQKRKECANRYYQLFEEADLLHRLALPHMATYNDHVFHLYVIQTPQKENLISYLTENGIGAGKHFPTALPHLTCYRSLGHKMGDFPMAEAFCHQSVSLPMYPELTYPQQAYVVSKIANFFKNHKLAGY